MFSCCKISCSFCFATPDNRPIDTHLNSFPSHDTIILAAVASLLTMINKQLFNQIYIFQNSI